MKYFPLGFSILSCIAAAANALAVSAHAELFFGGRAGDCQSTSNQSCAFGQGHVPKVGGALR